MSMPVMFRDGSIISQMFNDLKDQKVHKLSTFRAKYVKLGVKSPRFMLFRLCRVLRTNNQTNLQINSSKRTDTVQMVSRDKAEAAREAVKKLAKKGIVLHKATTKKPTAKATKKVVKAVKKSKHSTKPVAVPAGFNDDDVLEA